jgi:serine/threonine protein kinase
MPVDIEIPGYELKEQIGSGGMARVFLAIQENLGREVALKVLHKSLTEDSEEFRTRFLHEGQVLARLTHRSIVPIYDIGTHGEIVYMVMEYLRGGTLQERMKAGTMNVSDIIKIVAQISLALHTAHLQGIVHRDLKPSNIMFRNDVTPVLTDFGIARVLDSGQTLTQTGMMIGTPQYMSPEQIMARDVDQRSDIYSLGLMLYRLLTGKLPFEASEPMAIAMHQINTPPKPLPPELSELQPVIDLMLAKKPEDRYQSCVDFCNHLQRISLTDEDYVTEISAQTRIFDRSQLSDPSFRISDKTPSPKTEQTTWTGSAINTLLGKNSLQKKIRLGVLGLVMALSVGAYIMFKPSYDLSPIEERRIEKLLDRFEGYMITNNFYEPADENAADMLRKVFEMAPDYRPALEAADRLAEEYWTDAIDRIDQGDLEGALQFVDDGLQLAPEHEALLDVQQQISTAFTERERREDISRLLATAEQALEQDRLAPPDPDNAYDAFRSVLELDELNETARSGLSDIQRDLVAQARSSWEAGESVAATSLLTRVDTLFPGSALVVSLQNEITEAERMAGEQREIEQLLTRAETQFENQQLVTPAGDNALETYDQILAIRPDDQLAVAGKNRIADIYLSQANAALESEDLTGSLRAASAGLKAIPEHPELLAVQDHATGMLDEKSRMVQTRLQLAERLANAGRFFPGYSVTPGTPGFIPVQEEGNALEVYQSIEELDADNPSARLGIAGIPNKVFAAATTLQREGELEQSKALLQAALKPFPDEARYSGMIRNLDEEIARLEVQERLQNQLASLDSLLARSPVDSNLIDEFDRVFQETIRLFPNEIAVSERLTRFLTRITEQTEQYASVNDYEPALALLDYSLTVYLGNENLENAQSGLLNSQRQWVASISGRLAIDATPWGRVTEIRNQQNESIALPARAETPFLIVLPEGRYSIVVEGGDQATRAEMAVDVIAQQTTVQRADLNLMNAQAYFEKSGWHQHGND